MLMTENIKEIIEKIAYFDGTFPKEELQILLDNRELTTPFLLEAIRNPEKVFDKILNEDEYFLPFYALFMLAQFREPEAYPLVYELFSADAEKVNDAFDDFITEDLQRVLASVSGGDVSLINRLIEDENVYEFVRSAATDSYLCLIRAGLRTREEVIAYYKTLFEKPSEELDFLCGSLAWCCLEMKAVELLPEIRKSYDENRIDIGLMGEWEDFLEDINNQESHFLNGSDENFDLVDDLISDLADWHCFSEPKDYLPKPEISSTEPLPKFDLPQDKFWDSDSDGTFVHETPKVGKNDPCPCGSGRKYKKCCMN